MLNGRFKMYLVARLCVLSSFNTNYKQWCSPEMLTRGGGGAVQKCPELGGGGRVTYSMVFWIF